MASATESTRASQGDRADRAVQAIAVADAGWFTTAHLFRAIASETTPTLLLQCMDYRNARNKGIPLWRLRRRPVLTGPGCWDGVQVLPPGWMKRAPRFGMWPIARMLNRWHRREAASAPLSLVMTYPYYLHLRDRVRPRTAIYYNLDDYALYWPEHAREVTELEDRAVRESDLTICVARARADQLRLRVPEAASRIHHIPHGTPEWALVDQPLDRPAPAPRDIQHLPRPLLGYVGSLEDRVDWPLLSQVADANPAASVVILGRPALLGSESWQAECAACLARPNVHAIGWREQSQISAYNQAFDVILIPYRIDHPFNLACSPTKIMDSMGSTRPVVSTAIPECRLYADLFDVAADSGSFLAAIERILANGSDDKKALARLEHARAHSCRNVAERILNLIRS